MQGTGWNTALTSTPLDLNSPRTSRTANSFSARARLLAFQGVPELWWDPRRHRDRGSRGPAWPAQQGAATVKARGCEVTTDQLVCSPVFRAVRLFVLEPRARLHRGLDQSNKSRHQHHIIQHSPPFHTNSLDFTQQTSPSLSLSRHK